MTVEFVRRHGARRIALLALAGLVVLSMGSGRAARAALLEPGGQHPTIVLVGHSYGDMVMTDAALGNPNVRALVYIAAFAPDAGETVATIEAMNPGSEVGLSSLTLRPYPGGVDAYITPNVFHRVFCADVPPQTASLMAATQRPLDAAVEAEPSGPPAWRTIPSWYLVASDDRAIPPATERYMAKRAGAATVEIASSHVAMISHPAAVTALVLEAVRATSHQ
jgi:pimeloyl-ACP methyl ester carboxylesterase